MRSLLNELIPEIRFSVYLSLGWFHNERGGIETFGNLRMVYNISSWILGFIVSAQMHILC